jgi:hypothetical protein
MRYAISYDLNKQGQDYQTLYDALKRLGATRMLYSEWVAIHNNSSSEKLRDWLWTFMDRNDRLLVKCLDSGDWAGMNLMVNPNTLAA